MKKWILRVLYALLVLLPVAAIADYTATQGSGTTIFTFTCFSTKLCPAHVLTNSAGAEIMTTGAPGQIGAPAGAMTNGWDATQGTTTDAVATTPTSGSAATMIALSKAIANGVTAAIPAGTNTIGNVNSAINVTATACSGTIATGGTAQNAFTAQTTLHGFTIVNIDTTEPLWVSFTTTAAASGTDSYPLQAATASTFANPGSFTSPTGFGLNHAVSVIAATTSHKYSCTWW